MNTNKIVMWLCLISAIGCAIYGSILMITNQFSQASCYLIVSLINFIGIKEMKE